MRLLKFKSYKYINDKEKPTSKYIGGGGGGFSPDFCENTIFRYELAMMARTCTNNLRVVLSPKVQHCPCEALEQKWAPKTKFDSSRRDSHFSVFVCQNWMKNGQVMTMGSARAKVASGLFCAN